MSSNSDEQNLFSFVLKPDANGKVIFYPWGPFSQGYVVSDLAREKVIEGSLTTSGWVYGVLILLVIAISDERGQGLYLALLMLVSTLEYRIKVARLTRGLEVVEVGSSLYTPPTIEKKYRGLFYTILIGGFIGALGNLFNYGYTAPNFLMALASGIFIVLLIYINWIRK